MYLEAPEGESRAQTLYRKLSKDGFAFVNYLFDNQIHEDLFLEYKKIDTDHNCKSLHESDRKNLRKALSGFANSEGGVILWGVETQKQEKREVILKPKGHPQAGRFAGLVTDAVSGLTTPVVPGVVSHIIWNDEKSVGFVATLIPASNYAPHQTTDHGRSYYMRAGSSFEHVPHAVVAGLFGRRPAPKLYLAQRLLDCSVPDPSERLPLCIKMDVGLQNKSGIIARDAYISWEFKRLGVPYSRVASSLLEREGWHLTGPDQRNGAALANEGFRVAPYSRLDIAGFTVMMPFENTESVEIIWRYGCEGQTPQTHRHYLDQHRLRAELHNLRTIPVSTSGGMDEVARAAIGTRICISAPSDY